MVAPVFGTNPDLLYVWFPLIFIALMGGLFILFIKILGKLSKAEVSLYDVAYGLVAYTSFLFFYNFANSYFADVFMLDIMETFMWVYGFGLLFIPLVGLVISWIKNGGTQ